MPSMPPTDYFVQNYKVLRHPHKPMEWMKRMFTQIVSGQPPSLVDLPTGAGKTELAAIWLIALAWYGLDRAQHKPVPRRLVWVVNRRVLVQQVFRIAREMRERLNSAESTELEPLRRGLRCISGDLDEFFRVVELRGQIVQDAEWAIRPSVPQLVIGTVDQIGSRVLFQGYGLGKWGRPQQAGLLGVDAWIAIDEAHLVPAFVLTLRQLREQCASSTKALPEPLDAVFARLPFWLTELSATPGLPPPSSVPPFSLTDEEKVDPRIEPRIFAANMKRVLVEWLPKTEKKNEALVQRLVAAATASKSRRIAVFVREVRVADAVARGIATKLKEQGRGPNCICKITGRIRGYERDGLEKQQAFEAFRLQREAHTDEVEDQQYFLIGTAAAEVGLDADADVIFCDFASLPILLQRLGRLDRLGFLSRRHEQGNGEQPTMWVLASPDETTQKVEKQLSKLARAVKGDVSPWSADLMSGAHWLSVLKTKDEKVADEAKEEKSAKDETHLLIDAATWGVLSPAAGVCSQPAGWLAHDFARVAAGPVMVPPVTDPVLDYWSATTEVRSPHLSPHPFLYGLAEDSEGTPLVGVAFRLEVEALREGISDDDDNETPNAATSVVEIFKQFPPLRAELHQVKLATLREWLATAEAEEHPFVYRHRDEWCAKEAGESISAARAAIGPNGTLIFPACESMRSVCKKLLDDNQSFGSWDATFHDVLEGVSESARYRRTIEPVIGRKGDEGAWIWDSVSESAQAQPSKASTPVGFRRSFSKALRIGNVDYIFRYFRPEQEQSRQLQYLDDHYGERGHLARAEAQAGELADAIAPGEAFLHLLLSVSAHNHDEGKRFPKWQKAFGRPKDGPEIAKLYPDLERPAPLGGYRHEWESLRRLAHPKFTAPLVIPEASRGLWRDLVLHLVGTHHGHLRPSIVDSGFTPDTEAEKHNSLRLEAAERFTRLQAQIGRWRLAYLEALLKTADAEGSREISDEEVDDGT